MKVNRNNYYLLTLALMDKKWIKLTVTERFIRSNKKVFHPSKILARDSLFAYLSIGPEKSSLTWQTEAEQSRNKSLTQNKTALRGDRIKYHHMEII